MVDCNCNNLPTPTPTDDLVILTPTPSAGVTVSFYRFVECVTSNSFHAPKDTMCLSGNLAILNNTFEVGDIIQFVNKSEGCGGTTYCAEIIDTDFQALSNTENAMISRSSTVGGCDDTLHC